MQSHVSLGYHASKEILKNNQLTKQTKKSPKNKREEEAITYLVKKQTNCLYIAEV